MSKFVALALAALATTVVAAPANLTARQGADVIFNCVRPNTAALTFDDGPYWYMQDISNTLTNAGAKGTFFLNGNNWGCIYDDGLIANIRYAYNAGHQMASHTWYHKNLATLTWDQVHDEMWRVELALQRIIGAQPAFMRPPYGSYNQNVRDASQVRGQKLVIWDFDSGDSAGVSAAESKQRYTNTANAHPNTVLALNHETYASTAYDVLPHAISVLKGAGYNLVTLAECLGQPAYQWVGSPQTKTADWHC